MAAAIDCGLLFGGHVLETGVSLLHKLFREFNDVCPDRLTKRAFSSPQAKLPEKDSAQATTL